MNKVEQAFEDWFMQLDEDWLMNAPAAEIARVAVAWKEQQDLACVEAVKDKFLDYGDVLYACDLLTARIKGAE